MPTNTFFDPQNISQFEKTKLNKCALGIEGIAVPLVNTNIDYLFTDDSLITKGKLLVDGAVKGDKISLQVIHPVYGMVLEVVKDWYLDWTCVKQDVPESNYPAKIASGLTLRLIYHSTGINPVWIALNLDKEKILE